MREEQLKGDSVGASVPAQQVAFKRDEAKFWSGYANNVIVESNAFDMKLIFGLWDHRNPLGPVIEQFGSMSLSWPEAKLLIYWMQVHLSGYERDNGKVKIPAAVLPPEVPALPPPPFDNVKGREGFELLRKMREDFLASIAEP